MAEIRLALTGFGNVGQGVAQLLSENGEEYRRTYGVDLVLSGVADRGGALVASDGISPDMLLKAKREHGSIAGGPDGKPGMRGDEFLDAARAVVLIEAASTNFTDAEPGWGYAHGAVARGMDVVLASKGALVLHFDELMDMAARAGRRVLYAATIGAPVPILELAGQVLVGVRILELDGIVNATANQILAVMSDGHTYEEGVKAAQEAGVAETDPTLDVDGWDAAAKAVILARTIFGAPVTLDEVQRQGIRGITAEQLTTARESGQVYKLIARITRGEKGVSATVQPELRSRDDPLGRLPGTGMGVVFKTDLLGELTSTVAGGSGGGIVTALTVLRDVVNLARERGWSG